MNLEPYLWQRVKYNAACPSISLYNSIIQATIYKYVYIHISRTAHNYSPTSYPKVCSPLNDSHLIIIAVPLPRISTGV